MSSKEITPENWDAYPADGDREQIPNRERECGWLKAGHAYVRCDPAAFSEDGILPGFVVFTDGGGDLHPIPYKESLPRGYETINGSNFLAAVEAERQIRCLYPGPDFAEETHEDAHERALENHVDRGVFNTVQAVPDSELERHLGRVNIRGFQDGDHWGEIPPAQSKDLLMRAGKSYYQEPWDFIDEALELGLNKGISVASNKAPPSIDSGRTRCWIIHPHACGEDMPGVVGFSYLTRTVFTRDKDGEVPAYAKDHAEAGKMDIVDIGEPIPREDDADREGDDVAEAHQSLSEFIGDTAADELGPTTPAADVAELPKADLSELAAEAWIPATDPPADVDVLLQGDTIAIVDGARIPTSNNWTYDSESAWGSQQSGPYTVQMKIEDGDRLVNVEKN